MALYERPDIAGLEPSQPSNLYDRDPSFGCELAHQPEAAAEPGCHLVGRKKRRRVVWVTLHDHRFEDRVDKKVSTR
jgi:hypothetical protein